MADQVTKAPRAVVLLSGGLDSSTAAAIARSEGFSIYALTVDYGQRHAREIESAGLVAKSLGAAKHIVIPLNLRLFGGSALTDDIEVPTGRSHHEIGSGIPATYVPARNIVFLSLAASFAETVNAQDIFLGVSQIDYSGYPDCRAEFVQAFERAVNLGTKAGVQGEGFRIHTPLINLSKSETIALGIRLGLDYSLTWSCYLGGDLACGECDSCRLRLAAFEQAGIADPILYQGRVSSGAQG